MITAPGDVTPEEGERDPDAHGELSRGELASVAVKGARWVAISRFLYEIVAFSANIALTRLIAPAEFGSAAVALVLPMLATILAFEGFGSALVQRKTVTPQHEQAAVFMSVTLGALLTVLAALGALLIGPSIFGERTAHLLALMSPVFFLAGFTSVPRARLQRRLEFRRLSMNDVISFTANTLVAIPLAIAGMGGMALVIGLLVGQVAGTLLIVQAAGLPRPGFSSEESREILRYGIPASAGGIIYSLRTAMPWIVLGATISPVLVGLYYRAYQLGAEYQAKVGVVMLSVVFPVFSRAANLTDLQALRRKAVRISALIITPALGLLIVTAHEVVYIMYGPKWMDAVTATQILALVGMIQALMSGTEGLVLALGKPRALLVFHITFALTYLVVLTITGTSHDLVTISFGTFGVFFLMLILSQIFLVQRYAELPFSELLHDAGPSMISTGAAMAVGYGVATALRDASVPSFFVVLLVGIVGGGVYGLMLKIVFPAVWGDLRRLPGLLKKR